MSRLYEVGSLQGAWCLYVYEYNGILFDSVFLPLLGFPSRTGKRKTVQLSAPLVRGMGDSCPAIGRRKWWTLAFLCSMEQTTPRV